MGRFSRASTALLSVALSVSGVAQNQEQTSSLMVQFREARNLPEKEALLNRIAQRGQEAGYLLLQLAKSTADNDTRWLAIRGLGRIRFVEAAPFLVASLQSKEHYVRANAARALGELQYSGAVPALIHQLEVEGDSGVIEQTSLALGMMKAADAIPVLKSRMSFNSVQTRCWLLQAIASVGSNNDVPFIAEYLYGADGALGGLPFCAARALATLTGEDFGLPRQGGLFNPEAPVLKARKWWEQAQHP
jgi:HEAT repeat protein